MDIHLMSQRRGFYETALRERTRQKAAKTLACESCGARNKPGLQLIDLDDYDTAWCKCGACWAVAVDYSV